VRLIQLIGILHIIYRGQSSNLEHPISFRGGKNTHIHGYSWVKSVTGTGRVTKWVSTGIINGYLTTHYYIDTDLIVSIPENKLSKLLKYLSIFYLLI